jgi:molecular chaperone DnaK (HSP70)
VGDHILLGGDNIDLALAGAVAARLAEKGTRIDSRQMQALWNNCRVAKEKLLDPESTGAGTAGDHSRQGHRPGGRHHQGVAAARAISTR